MFSQEDKLIIGKKIKEFRKRKQMTQFVLAEKVGLHEKQISRIESGLNYPTLISFMKIMDALELQFSDFTIDSQGIDSQTKKELLYIIRHSDEVELKIYLDILKPLRKHLKNIK